MSILLSRLFSDSLASDPFSPMFVQPSCVSNSGSRRKPTSKVVLGSQQQQLQVVPRDFKLMIHEDNENYTIQASIPGANKDGISVSVLSKSLELTASVEQIHEEGDEQRMFWSKTESRITRKFLLPEDANEDDVDAKFEEGVLKVRIGKVHVEATPVDESTRKTIAIQ